MADHKHKETRQLAHDCVHMTLHGPLPMETVAKLCTGVMELYDEFVEPKKHSHEMPGDGLTFTSDPVVAIEAWKNEAKDLEVRVRELEARIGSMQ